MEHSKPRTVRIDQALFALVFDPWDDYQPCRFKKKKKPKDPILIGPFEFEYVSDIL